LWTSSPPFSTGANKLVPDLTENDFKLSDEGVPQTIKYFSRQSDIPLRIGLLLDTSNSIRDRIKLSRSRRQFPLHRSPTRQGSSLRHDVRRRTADGTRLHRRHRPAARSSFENARRRRHRRLRRNFTMLVPSISAIRRALRPISRTSSAVSDSHQRRRRQPLRSHARRSRGNGAAYRRRHLHH